MILLDQGRLAALYSDHCRQVLATVHDTIGPGEAGCCRQAAAICCDDLCRPDICTYNTCSLVAEHSGANKAIGNGKASGSH